MRPGGSHRPGVARRKVRHSATARSTSISPARSTRSPEASTSFSWSTKATGTWSATRRRSRCIGTGVEDGQPRPLFWARQAGKGRVFVSIPGHFTWTFDDPLFRVLILRGIAWTAGEPVDRFNELATLGVKDQRMIRGRQSLP